MKFNMQILISRFFAYRMVVSRWENWSWRYWLCSFCLAVHDVTQSQAVSLKPNHNTRRGETTWNVTQLRTRSGVRSVIMLFASPLSPRYFLVPATLRPFMFMNLLVKTEQVMVDELCFVWVCLGMYSSYGTGYTILVFIFMFNLSVFLAPPSVQTRKKNSPSSSPVVNKKDRKGSKPSELTGKLFNTIPGPYKGIVSYVRKCFIRFPSVWKSDETVFWAFNIPS